ncbi:hypothetical protein ACCO45_009223 [Purpureocillium lilacinum]|uniref:Uncharacterized protein n=1 Tax=Purpureocillium lilacinum TaxID=33203 RepID=A0ACC4DJ38_PURLI
MSPSINSSSRPCSEQDQAVGVDGKACTLGLRKNLSRPQPGLSAKARKASNQQSWSGRGLPGPGEGTALARRQAMAAQGHGGYGGTRDQSRQPGNARHGI